MTFGVYVDGQDSPSLDLVAAGGVRIFGIRCVKGFWLSVCGSVGFGRALVGLSCDSGGE
jgi:hypothetical protein